MQTPRTHPIEPGCFHGFVAGWCAGGHPLPWQGVVPPPGAGGSACASGLARATAPVARAPAISIRSANTQSPPHNKRSAHQIARLFGSVLGSGVAGTRRTPHRRDGRPRRCLGVDLKGFVDRSMPAESLPHTCFQPANAVAAGMAWVAAQSAAPVPDVRACSTAARPHPLGNSAAGRRRRSVPGSRAAVPKEGRTTAPTKARP